MSRCYLEKWSMFLGVFYFFIRYRRQAKIFLGRNQPTLPSLDEGVEPQLRKLLFIFQSLLCHLQ